MRSYFLFSAILCLVGSLLILTSASWITVALFIYFLLRIFGTKRKQLIIGSLLLTGLIILSTSFHQWTNTTDLTPQDHTFIIKVTPDQIKIDGDQLQFDGIIKQTNHHTKFSEKIVVFYTLQSLEEKNMWESQDKSIMVTITGKLEIPGENRNQYQFSYQSYLYHKKIHWILMADTIHSIEQPKLSVLNKVAPKNMRSKILKYIDEKMTIKTSQYMKTLLFADLGSFDKATVQQFKKIGIIHLLSISGLHIQFFLTGLVYLLWRIGLTKEKTVYIMLILLPFYGNLTGWGTSVYRAIIMALILLISSYLKIIISSLDAWSWTLISTLIINPYQVFSIGFQLSYLLSFILLILTQTYFTIPRHPLYLNFTISFILMLVSIPILSYHFFEFSWIGVFSNLLFVPLFTWILLPVFILLLFLSVLFYSSPFFQHTLVSLENFLTIIEKIVEKISNLPFITIITGRVPIFLTFIFIISLIFFILSLETDGKNNKMRIRSIILLMTSLLLFSCYQRYSPYDKVIVIDVGQGDALLIKESFGKGSYLIDTGGSLTFEKKKWQEKKNPSSIAERIVIPSLKSQGISSLDKVLISHGDEDHYGALLEMTQSIKVKELLFPIGALTKPSFQNTVLKIANSETSIREIKASRNALTYVTPSLAILWPLTQGEGENNDSMVLHGKIGSYYWLFTGDIEEGEKQLIREYPNLKVDVLKVAHHGSKTSSSKDFLNNIQPSYAIISCGLNNRYNHPNSEVINRISNKNTHIYRTDMSGAIHYEYLKIGKWVVKESFHTLIESKD